MSINLITWLALLVSACGTSAAPVGDDAGTPVDDPRIGGTLALPAPCGYTVTTRDGATAPTMGSPMMGPDPTPFAIHLGLTTAQSPSTSMAIVWRTKDETTLATTVQFGVGAATDKQVDGFTFVYDTAQSGTIRIHEVDLCGLTPGTTYSYRVASSPTFQFHTAPDPALKSASVVVAVLGDSRTNYPQWGATLTALEGITSPDLVLFSGDAITLGLVQSEWDEWFRQAAPLLNHVPLVAAQGNHEINAINYYSQLAMPGNRENYGFDYGALHVTVVNDTPLGGLAEVTSTQAHFLDSDLTAATAPWKVVMHHEPIWSSAVAHGSNKDLLAAWGPIIDSHKVDLVLNGHDHNYERTQPMRGMTPGATNADGTVYLIAGSAGAYLYDNGTSFFTAYSEKTFNFAILRATAHAIDIKAFRPDGTVIDQTTLAK